jgi:acyl-CoA dehydrogenase
MSIGTDSDLEFATSVRRIADEVAAAHADDVDHNARFPREAIDALREAGALSAWIPEEYGGGGVSLESIAQACYDLARGCSSTAMVFAMHQIQVGTIFRHIEGQTWFEGYLQEVCADQRLIASATSEVGTGGDMGRSVAAVTPIGDGRFMLEKRAPVVSYGAYSDDILTTVRRSPEGEQSDQVMVLHRTAETEMELTGSWDTIGMRGTCSPGFVLRAKFPAGQILSAPFAKMMAESIVPLSHLLWSYAWLGIATEAFERGRAFVRAQSRRNPGQPVPAAHNLSRVMGQLSMLRSEVGGALEDYMRWSSAPGREPLSTMASILRFNNLKLGASEQAPKICQDVLEVVGIMAYKNDSPYGVGRHLRDTLSARLMVANERINAIDAGLLMIAKEV